MVYGSLCETNRDVLSTLKRAVKERPASTSSGPMGNLKRRRESPSSGSDSTPFPTTVSAPASVSTSISSSTPSSLLSVPPRPGFQHSTLPSFHYPLQHASNQRKRVKMPSPSRYVTTTAGDEFTYIQTSAGSYSTVTAGMPAPFHPSAVSMPPPPTTYSGVGSGPPHTTYPAEPITSASGPSYYQLAQFPDPEYSPGPPEIQIGPVENVEDVRKRRRQERNREAQKNFRERQKREQHDLALRVQTLEKSLEHANADKATILEQLERVKLENERLKQQLHSMRSSDSLSASYQNPTGK